MTPTTEPPKRIIRIAKSSKRICPTCRRYTRITITNDGTGWQVWICSANGCRNDYQLTGRVN